MNTYLKLVEKMAQSLVDIPEEVRVEEVRGIQVSIFKLHVASSDMGKVIGRQGRLADAMRYILRVAGMKENRRLRLEILDIE